MTQPDRLGKYEVRSALGKGAMGVVYKAFDPHIERYVALKTIRKDTVDPDLAKQFLVRFKNEAKAAGRLHHPNIVGVYEYGEDDEVAFIAMEYVEGTGLREYLNRKTTFDFGQLVALMSQLLAALEYAHASGIVHRDIKPSNLIVDRHGALKVADFGVARVDTSNLTTVGMVIGTPSYMSPEQCKGRDADARSDLFSAGVVLYELLTGRKPFTGTVEAIAHKICYEDPPPPSTVSPIKLPEAVDPVVATALAKDPAKRFPSARAFGDALRALAQTDVSIDDALGTTIMNIASMPLAKPAPAWDDATLDTVEHELARFLGPVAKIIVRRAAAQTHDHGELCSILSENIADADTRRRFVDAFSRNPLITGSHASAAPRTFPSAERSASKPGRSTTSKAAPHASTPGVPLDAAYVDEVTARLAIYLGPIARIVTKKAAQQASGRAEFVRLVAENLGTQERVAFLRDMGYGAAD
jgi:serine/threonine-protein kinase